jgi:YD repeat-containing protein
LAWQSQYVDARLVTSTSAPRYYYVYDARGDVVNLTDATGAVVASYSYDTWGALTASSESIPNAGGWVNPSRYDGRDRARYDAANA